MSARALFQSVLFSIAMVGIFSPAYALTEQELTAKLESAGYSQIRDVKSTAEGTVVKAMKNGKEVSLVVDSSGQYRERQEIGTSPAANPPAVTPVQPERSPRQSEQSRDQERRSAEDVHVGRDWRTEQRDGDCMGRRMGRMNDEDESDHRTVGRNWRMLRDRGWGYYD
jgi:hypothetical protein